MDVVNQGQICHSAVSRGPFNKLRVVGRTVIPFTSEESGVHRGGTCYQGHMAAE